MAKKSLMFSSSVLIVSALCISISTSEEFSEVSCALGTNCVLPCVFEAGSVISILWWKSPGESRVHRYFYNQNQYQHQSQDYRDRTALSNVYRGDASLLLSEVRVQDEGQYVCFTSTTSGSRVSNIYLKVIVNIGEVSLVRQGSDLVCRSEGLHPEPRVDWASEFWFFWATTTVHQREDQLYDITSTITPWFNSGPHPHPGTVCTVRTSRSSSTVVLTEEVHLRVLYNAAVLHCSDSKAPNLVWKFNQTQTIVTRSGSDLVYNESWSQFVDGLTQFNHLVLKDLTKEQEGLYSCHIQSTDRQTLVTTIQLEIEWERKMKEMIVQIICWILFFLTIGAFCGYLVRKYLDLETIAQSNRSFFSVLRERLVHFHDPAEHLGRNESEEKRVKGHRQTEKKKH